MKMKYYFFNPVEETYKLSVNLLMSPCQILPTAENRWRHCKQSTYMVVWYLWCFERVWDEINGRNHLRL